MITEQPRNNIHHPGSHHELNAAALLRVILISRRFPQATGLLEDLAGHDDALDRGSGTTAGRTLLHRESGPRGTLPQTKGSGAIPFPPLPGLHMLKADDAEEVRS